MSTLRTILAEEGLIKTASGWQGPYLSFLAGYANKNMGARFDAISGGPTPPKMDWSPSGGGDWAYWTQTSGSDGVYLTYAEGSLWVNRSSDDTSNKKLTGNVAQDLKAIQKTLRG